MTLLLWLARLALPTLMVVGLLIDTRFQIAAEDIEKTIGLETESAVSSSESLTSTWYCPTAYSRKLEASGVEAQSELVITNTAAEPTRATIHLISPTSARRLVRLEVPGLSTRSLEVADHTTDELVSALVEAPISGIAVSRRIRSTYGSDVASCSSVVADASSKVIVTSSR